MAYIKKKYDAKTRTDRVLYESSNVIYSSFIEHPEDNFGDLYVVFKEGKQYKYENVSYQDYLMFKHGGLDGSSGKALNSFIIKKYKAEKIEDADVSKLIEEINTPDDAETTYFLHGDKQFEEEVFEKYYIPTLTYVLESVPDAKFVFFVDDNEYVERSIKYLYDVGVGKDRIKGYILESMDVPKFFYDNVPDIETLPHSDYKSSTDAYEYLATITAGDVAFVSEASRNKIKLLSESAYIILSRYFK